MTRRVFLIVAGGVLLAARGAAAQTQAPGGTYAPGSLDRYFKFEWTRSGSKLSGYVYSSANRHAARVQVLVEGLDGSGKVIGTTTTWVLGGIPPGGRAYFEASAPRGGSYRVRVLSFEWSEPADRRRW